MAGFTFPKRYQFVVTEGKARTRCFAESERRTMRQAVVDQGEYLRAMLWGGWTWKAASQVLVSPDGKVYREARIIEREVR